MERKIENLTARYIYYIRLKPDSTANYTHYIIIGENHAR